MKNVTGFSTIITKIIIAVITTLGIKFLAFDYAEHPTVSASRKVNKRKHIQHAFTVSALRGIVFSLSYIPIIFLFTLYILKYNIIVMYRCFEYLFKLKMGNW